MYHYAGNNPISYSDPDGRNTKKSKDIYHDVLIVVATSNTTGSGQHAMMLYRDKTNTYNNIMVDASGSYAHSKGRTNNSPVLKRTSSYNVTLAEYVNYFRGQKNETLYIYKITADPETIKKIAQAMNDVEDDFEFLSCATTVSKVILNTKLFKGFKQTCFPKKIKNYFDQWIKDNKNNTDISIELTKIDLMDKETKFDFGDY